MNPLRGDWDKPATFRKARVGRDGEAVDIDWAADSAVRFFPIERDPLFGWRLHLFDMATNKALAHGHAAAVVIPTPCSYSIRTSQGLRILSKSKEQE
ncbi:MAG TPA: hypothetical protein PLA50_19470 [Bacteroidia bacterium]|nr:hypothetical protein [Bacteroidia bacterium]